MKISQQKISPKLAAAMLEKNFDKNRKLRQDAVNRYAADMAAGRWLDTGEPIKFNTPGHLIDGQHRLSAIVQSGVTLTIWVATDVPSEAIKAIDTGRSRTAEDVLSINSNLRHPKHLPILIRRIAAWETGKMDKTLRNRRGVFTPQQILEYAEANPGLSEHILFSFQAYAKSVQPLTLTQGEWAFLHWLLSQKSPDQATVFLLELAELTCPKESPIRQLFARLNGQVPLPSKMRINFTVRAWNAWREGKKEVRLKAKETEEPVPALV